MDGLTPGRIVHFVAHDGVHLAAVVVAVEVPADLYTPLADLYVFDPAQGPHFVPAFYSEHDEAGTWHWIERA
jgi:hypothetical protein